MKTIDATPNLGQPELLIKFVTLDQTRANALFSSDDEFINFTQTCGSNYIKINDQGTITKMISDYSTYLRRYFQASAQNKIFLDFVLNSISAIDEALLEFSDKPKTIKEDLIVPYLKRMFELSPSIIIKNMVFDGMTFKDSNFESYNKTVSLVSYDKENLPFNLRTPRIREFKPFSFVIFDNCKFQNCNFDYLKLDQNNIFNDCRFNSNKFNFCNNIETLFENNNCFETNEFNGCILKFSSNPYLKIKKPNTTGNILKFCFIDDEFYVFDPRSNKMNMAAATSLEGEDIKENLKFLAASIGDSNLTQKFMGAICAKYGIVQAGNSIFTNNFPLLSKTPIQQDLFKSNAKSLVFMIPILQEKGLPNELIEVIAEFTFGITFCKQLPLNKMIKFYTDRTKMTNPNRDIEVELDSFILRYPEKMLLKEAKIYKPNLVPSFQATKEFYYPECNIV